jgi:hypothetical protein
MRPISNKENMESYPQLSRDKDRLDELRLELKSAYSQIAALKETNKQLAVRAENSVIRSPVRKRKRRVTARPGRNSTFYANRTPTSSSSCATMRISTADCERNSKGPRGNAANSPNNSRIPETAPITT